MAFGQRFGENEKKTRGYFREWEIFQRKRSPLCSFFWIGQILSTSIGGIFKESYGRKA